MHAVSVPGGIVLVVVVPEAVEATVAVVPVAVDSVVVVTVVLAQRIPLLLPHRKFKQFYFFN